MTSEPILLAYWPVRQQLNRLSWLATPLQNYINLTQTRVEILVFVQKPKMAAVAILDFIFVQYYSQFVRRTIK